MRRFIAFSLSLLLVLGLILPTVAIAAPQMAPASAGVTLTGPKDKVAPELTAAFAKDEYVSYMVTLTEQADPATAARTAREGLPSARSAAAELMGRVGVIRALKETAERTQYGLVRTLDGYKGRGLVKSYRTYYLINALEITSTEAVMEAIAKRPEIAKIWPNMKRQLIDPKERTAALDQTVKLQASVEAHLTGTESVEWNVRKIGAPKAWDENIDGTGIVIAGLDTGVQWDHPALKAKWRGLDSTTGEPGAMAACSWFDAVNGDSLPYDDNGHGTHTMGTMVGSEPDGSNQIGVAPGAQWIAAKVLDDLGYGTDADILAAAEWLTAPGEDPNMAPDVVNNSWGGGAGLNEWFRPAVQAWEAAGIVPVFSAGNDGPSDQTVTAPGNYPESFCVSATTVEDKLAYFSSRGRSPYEEPFDQKPDVSAPGANIRSSVPGGLYEGGWSGTSMASPCVAATAALIKQADSSLTVAEIEEILKTTAVQLENGDYLDVPNYGFGWGRVDAYAAVSMALPGVGSGEVIGTVTVSGDDVDTPSVEDHSLIDEVCSGMRVRLFCLASDSVSIVSADAYVRPNATAGFTKVPLGLESGDYKSGSYGGYPPADLFQAGQDAEYYIEVKDFAGHSARTATQAVQVKAVQDFESGPDGWFHYAYWDPDFESPDPWQLGEPTSGPMAAHSGSNVFATNLSGQYEDNTIAYLLTPWIDLRSGGPARLSFSHWYDFAEDGYDAGCIYISTDGANYSWIGDYVGSSGDWVRGDVDLTPYTNQVVRVMFALETNESYVADGWYIDDVAVIRPDGVTPSAPTNLLAADVDGDMTLTWTPPEDFDVAKYRIYRSATSGVDYVPIATIGSDEALYIDPDPQPENYYIITAIDMGGLESAPSSEAGCSAASLPNTIYWNNFESDSTDWSTGGVGSEWQAGTPTAGPGTAHSGDNLWFIGPYYTPLGDSWLESPSIDVSGCSSPALSFWHWLDLELWCDYGHLEVYTDDGASWEEISRWTGNASFMGWMNHYADLSPYLGPTTQSVRVRFRVDSDESLSGQGWYIDDVRLIDAGGASELAASMQSSLAGPTSADPRAPKHPESITIETPSENTGETPPRVTELISADSSLPAQATVTVAETGVSTRTDPATGGYVLRHAAGAVTLRAEAYGYAPAEQGATIGDGSTTTVDFALEALPTGTVSGCVRDSDSSDPVAGAWLYLVEDPNVLAAVTDANGEFTLTGYGGDYTLHVNAVGYYPSETRATIVAGEDTTVDFDLDSFVGYPGDLAYDDGTPASGVQENYAGEGFGVIFTPEEVPAKLNSVSFLFYDDYFPYPGSDDFRYAIYDLNDDGTPGELLAGPYDASAIRDRSTWTVIDGLSLIVDGDFLVAELLSHDFPECPAICMDAGATDSERNLEYQGGAWIPWVVDPDLYKGNIMIRASLSYEVDVPSIVSPGDGALTNQKTVQVEGTTTPDVSVEVYLGDNAVDSTTAGPDGDFTAEVTLAEGPNTIAAAAVVDGQLTHRSAPVTVTLDTAPPTFTVETTGGAEANGYTTTDDGMTLVVTGSDDHLSDTVTVAKNGGTAVSYKNDDPTATEWQVPVALDFGPNDFAITMYDQAGNYSDQTVTITREVVLDSIEITTLPDEMTYYVGQSLDLTGLVVTAHYSDGSNQIIPNDNLTVTGFESSVPENDQEVTVSYGGKTATFTVDVLAVTLSSIEITHQPNKTTYYVGESLDLTGLEVKAHYSDGSMQAVSNDDLTVSGFDSSRSANDQVVFVNYQSRIAGFTVDILAVELQSIAVTTPPTKTTYFVGQSLDLTGLVVTGTYNDGSSHEVTITPAMITGFNSGAPAATQTVTVTYEGKTATFTVTIVAPALTSIAVTAPPTKTTYYVGQSLDLAGLQVTGTYEDGSTKPLTVTVAMTSGFDSASPVDDQTVIITYEGKTATFTVDIIHSYSVASFSNVTLTSLTTGYASGTQQTKTITITNTGTGSLTSLAVAISGTDADHFDITRPAATLNAGASTAFTVKAKDGLAAGTYQATVTVSADYLTPVTFTVTQSVNAPPSGGGGGYTPPPPAPVISDTGSATVNPAAGGTISQGDDVTLQIPANALSAGSSVEVSIHEETTPPEVPSGFEVLGTVYNFTVGGQNHYTFNAPVTLTFTFDPSKLGPGETPTVHYYDEASGQWIDIGGTVSGNTITVTIDHFTRFAVLAKAPTLILSDISGHWAEAQITRLVGMGAVSGYPDGTFQPNKTITRAEFVTILVKALKLEAKSGPAFVDCTGHWAEASIQTAAGWGIVGGYDATHFGPNDPITREQLVAMVVRALKLTSASTSTVFTDESAIAAWAMSAIDSAVAAGITGGYPDGSFRPQANATRAEAVTVLSKAIK